MFAARIEFQEWHLNKKHAESVQQCMLAPRQTPPRASYSIQHVWQTGRFHLHDCRIERERERTPPTAWYAWCLLHNLHVSSTTELDCWEVHLHPFIYCIWNGSISRRHAPDCVAADPLRKKTCFRTPSPRCTHGSWAGPTCRGLNMVGTQRPTCFTSMIVSGSVNALNCLMSRKVL